MPPRRPLPVLRVSEAAEILGSMEPPLLRGFYTSHRPRVHTGTFLVEKECRAREMNQDLRTGSAHGEAEDGQLILQLYTNVAASDHAHEWWCHDLVSKWAHIILHVE